MSLPSKYRSLYATTLMAGFLIFVSCGRPEALKKYYPLQIGDNGWDTVFQTLPDFLALNTEKDTIQRADVDSSIRILNFFSPKNGEEVIKSMQAVQAITTTLEEEDVQILSIAIAADSSTVLNQFVESHKLGANNWHFIVLITPPVDILSRNALHMSFPTADGGLEYDTRWVLLDKEGITRGKYAIQNENVIGQLLEDIDRLQSEYVPYYHWWQKNFWVQLFN